MIKFPLLLISYFGLFLMSIFSSEDVLVENNIPAMVAPGSRTLVEITINKGEIQGFSKLELDLPTGFTASPADIKGASFTFSSQKAKFVWMTLPGDKAFTVSYYIESDPNLEGPFEIDGEFSYVKENKRMDINIPSRTVIVKKDLEPTSQQISEMLPELKREAEVVELMCTRTLTKVSDTEYIVNLKVNNNNIQGFGKILETLPANCNSEKMNDGGAVITQDESTIKFVWFEVPAAESFEVSYKLSCIVPTSDPIIKGLLSYTEDGNPITIPIVQEASETPTVASVEEPLNTDTAENPVNTTTEVTPDTTTETEQVVTNQQPENNQATETVTNNEPVAEREPANTQVTSVPSAETGITYKVQILAAHRVVDKTYFMDKFSFDEKFNIENHEGWVKYTTGKFEDYKDARDARNRITGTSSKLPGPFVTAYNEGERITVQEALLISRQQWYK